MSKTTYTTTLAAQTCCVCGVPFALSAEHESELRRTGSYFYCPNGHSQHYTDTDEVRIRRMERELAQANGNARYLEERLAQEEHRSAAYKGQVTKIKKRVAAGVCPCCNRTFQNLARHMHGQHPEWKGEIAPIVKE